MGKRTRRSGGISAAILLGLDYEKASNRMKHDVCLDRLRQLGAWPGSISLVRLFLEGRSMTICIDGHRPEPVPITRGSPQASVLECLLYCVTTQASLDEGEVVFWSPSPPRRAPRREAADHQLASFLYLDDTTLFDRVSLSEGTRHFTTSATKEVFENLALEADFDCLAGRAEEIGMKINAKKTQLLVISPQNGCITINPGGGGELIQSVERMKLVGFTFGDSPSAGPHVEALEEMDALSPVGRRLEGQAAVPPVLLLHEVVI